MLFLAPNCELASRALPLSILVSKNYRLLYTYLERGAMEWWTNKGNVTMDTMFSDPARIPGNLGFDPMGMGKNGVSEDMQLKEIKNGRLAMLAISGMIHHNIVVDGPLF